MPSILIILGNVNLPLCSLQLHVPCLKPWHNEPHHSPLFWKNHLTLYPTYLSNYCNGGCLYCGIAADRRAFRAVLNVDQLDRELDAITQAGLDEVVLLTGERMPEADTSYIREAIERASRRLNNINIEVFPMQQSEYRSLAEWMYGGHTTKRPRSNCL